MSSKQNDPFYEVFHSLLTAVGELFAVCGNSAFRGARVLVKKNGWYLFGFVVSIAITAAIFGLKPFPYYQGGLVLPILYLFVMDSMTFTNTDDRFKSIDFMSRGKTYPYLIETRKDGKKLIYVFKSDIPIDEWQKAKSRLENAFECNILAFEEGKSKKILLMHTTIEKMAIMLKWDDRYIRREGELVVGENLLNTISFDLNKNPHVLVAGESGSGKSVTLKCLLWQMIRQQSEINMMDFKGGVEFGLDYEKYGEVIIDQKRCCEVLDSLIKENTRRLALIREARVTNIGEYNQKSRTKLKRIGVFIDELAEIMDVKGKDKEEKEMIQKIEGDLSTLARQSRATGINLIIGIQRPDHRVLPGQIKNNIPVRICGRFADSPVSEIVLNNTKATTLPDIKGRMLFQLGVNTVEFQAYYFDSNVMNDAYFEPEKKVAIETKPEPKVSQKPDLDFNFDIEKKH